MELCDSEFRHLTPQNIHTGVLNNLKRYAMAIVKGRVYFYQLIVSDSALKGQCRANACIQRNERRTVP